MNIRDAKIEDAKAISEIYASSWKRAYKGIVPQRYLEELKYDFWVEAFENWIGNGIFNVKIINDNEKMVGCIAYGDARDESMVGWGEIVSIYVHPNYFKGGYGKKLLRAALSDMEDKGYENIYLWVLKENYQARGFYERNGFKPCDEELEFEIMGKELIDIRYVYRV